MVPERASGHYAPVRGPGLTHRSAQETWGLISQSAPFFGLPVLDFVNRNPLVAGKSLRAGNHSLQLVGTLALRAAGVNRGADVVVSGSALHGAVLVVCGGIDYRVYFRERAAQLGAAVYVVSHHRGGTGTPAKTDDVWWGRRARSDQSLDHRRISSVAREGNASRRCTATRRCEDQENRCALACGDGSWKGQPTQLKLCAGGSGRRDRHVRSRGGKSRHQGLAGADGHAAEVHGARAGSQLSRRDAGG